MKTNLLERQTTDIDPEMASSANVTIWDKACYTPSRVQHPGTTYPPDIGTASADRVTVA